MIIACLLTHTICEKGEGRGRLKLKDISLFSPGYTIILCTMSCILLHVHSIYMASHDDSLVAFHKTPLEVSA